MKIASAGAASPAGHFPLSKKLSPVISRKPHRGLTHLKSPRPLSKRRLLRMRFQAIYLRLLKYFLSNRTTKPQSPSFITNSKASLKPMRIIVSPAASSHMASIRKPAREKICFHTWSTKGLNIKRKVM